VQLIPKFVAPDTILVKSFSETAFTHNALLELEFELDTPPPAPLELSLVLALPRPPALRRIVQSAAALGVKHITLLHSARVEKSYWQSPAVRPENLERELRLGLEQARDTVLPEVRIQRRFQHFVEHDLPAQQRSAVALLAHPDGPPCPHAARGAHVLLVGPEGGWLESEVRALRECGAQLAGLGSRTLRVETAVITLIGRLAP